MWNNFPLILVDESVDARITEALRQTGWETFSIQEKMPGTNDLDIINLAEKEGAFILTEDKDFGDAIVYRKSPHRGALLLRLAGVPIEEKFE